MARKRVLLVQPYFRSNFKINGKVYMSSLTLPVLAALTPKDWEPICLDENVEPIDFDGNYDLVGITVMTATAPRAYEIADEFRKRGVKVVLGGVHPSVLPEDAMPHADAIVIGEAEGIWEGLLRDYENGCLKKIYRAEAKPELKELPIPRRDLLKEKKYLNIPKVETSRGCPFDCSFCSTTEFFGRGIRYRPVHEVVEEIKRMKAKLVFFTDNNLVGNIAYAKRLFQALIPLKIRWIAQVSINFAKDEELVKLACKSGCQAVFIGFESISDEVLKMVGKTVNRVSEYYQAIKRLHKHCIGVMGGFVFGFDGDDKSVFKRTVEFIRKSCIEMPQLSILTPFPGARIREELKRQGRILHEMWEKYDGMQVCFKPLKMSVEELREMFDWAAQKVYSRWAIFCRILRSFRYHLRNPQRLYGYLLVNLFYRRLWLQSCAERT